MCCSTSPGSDWPTLRLLSQLADIGFVGLLIMVALITLAARGYLREALCWGAGMLLGLGTVLIIKRFMADDLDLPHFPSGHVALAVTFYGGLALALTRQQRPLSSWWPLYFVAMMGAIGLAEGISRVVLTEHNWLDTLGGLLIGAVGLVLAGNPWAWGPIGRRDQVWLGGTLIVALPFSWLIYPLVNPWLRRIAGV